MELYNRERIDKLLRGVKQLPTLPTVFIKLQKIIGDERTTAKEVGAVIEQDQALTTKILKVVNSAFYGFPGRISTVARAVVVLGFNEIKSLALSASLIDVFKSESDSNSLDYEAFWKHSLAVAACSRILAKRAGRLIIKDAEEAFVAGLLHDMGKIVEDQYIHDSFIKALNAVSEDQMLLIDAETKCIGVDHQHVGQRLSEIWGLPLSLISVVGYHHQPIIRKRDTLIFPLISVVHIADIIVRGMGFGSGGDPFVPNNINVESWACLNLKIGSIELIADETEKAYKELHSLLF